MFFLNLSVNIQAYTGSELKKKHLILSHLESLRKSYQFLFLTCVLMAYFHKHYHKSMFLF